MEQAEIEKLVENKAQEVVFKQRTQELYALLNDLMGKLPNSLNELERTMNMVIEDLKLHNTNSSNQLETLANQLLKVNTDLNGLFTKLEIAFTTASAGEESLFDSIADLNNPNSLINVLKNKLSEIADRQVTNQTELNGELKKRLSVMTVVSSILSAGLTIVLILTAIGVLGG